MFSCTALGCHRKEIGVFYSWDKLKYHVKHMHDSNTLFSCPEMDCNSKPMKPSSLRVHIIHHKVATQSYFEALLPIICPFPNCKRDRFPLLQSMHWDTHLPNHTEDDRLMNSEAIFKNGYDAKSCRAICPICHQLLGNYKFQVQNDFSFYSSLTEHLERHGKQEIIQHRCELLDLVPVKHRNNIWSFIEKQASESTEQDLFYC
jgi:hypothetical protein